MFITFLSDYGLEDDFVGVCHAAMARIAPDVRVIDLTHGVRRHDVRGGALALRRGLRYAPAGVHLAVVDPEVGGTRRAVALRTADEDRLLVGPDNGVLLPAADDFGGVVEAVEISGVAAPAAPSRRPSTAATSSRRSPRTSRPGRRWPRRASRSSRRSSSASGSPRRELEGDEIVAHAVAVDRFGNVALDATHDQLARTGLRLGTEVVVEAGGWRQMAQYAHAFSDVDEGDLLLYEDAYRTLALAVNRGSAAERLGLAQDAELRVRPA